MRAPAIAKRLASHALFFVAGCSGPGTSVVGLDAVIPSDGYMPDLVDAGSPHGDALTESGRRLVRSLVVRPERLAVPVGDRGMYMVEATYDDGATRDVSSQCSYESADPSVAGVVPGYPTIEALRRGTTTVSIAYLGARTTATFVGDPREFGASKPSMRFQRRCSRVGGIASPFRAAFA